MSNQLPQCEARLLLKLNKASRIALVALCFEMPSKFWRQLCTAYQLTSLVVYRFTHLLASAAWPPRRLLPHLRCHSYMAARKLSKSGRNAKTSIFKDQSINCGSAIATLVWATKVRTVDLPQLIAVLRPPQDCFNPSCTIPVSMSTYTLKFQPWFLGRLANVASCSHGIAVNCNQGITQGLPNSSGTFT